MNRKQIILRVQLANARFKLEPLAGPPEQLPAELAPVWHEIARAMSVGPTTADAHYLELMTRELAHWRAHGGDRAALRDLYRGFGQIIVPMRSRRALLFPDAAKPRNF